MTGTASSKRSATPSSPGRRSPTSTTSAPCSSRHSEGDRHATKCLTAALLFDRLVYITAIQEAAGNEAEAGRHETWGAPQVDGRRNRIQRPARGRRAAA